MAGRRKYKGLAFRIYSAAYIAIIGAGLIGDVTSGSGPPISSTRTSALVGLTVVAVVVVAGISGRNAVALRPTAAEVQLTLLSPAPRQVGLRRSAAVGVAGSALAVVAGALVAMTLAPSHFAGLSAVGVTGFIGFAGGVGALAFAAHLLVAEGRHKLISVAGVAVTLTLAADVMRASGQTAVTALLRRLLAGSPLPALAAISILAGPAGWVAWRGIERLSLERIARGADASELASFALAGNDVRSFALVLRSFGRPPWRDKPLFTVPTGFALRYPAAARSLRCVARWRSSRWIAVAILSAVTVALLTSGAPSITRAALAALLLWALGLAVSEPLAEENDRQDRLALLPDANLVELRLIGVSAVIAFSVLFVSLATQLPIVTALGLAVAATSAAVVSSSMSLRSTWKLLMNPDLLGQPPEAIAGQMLYKLTRPAIVAFVCLVGWRTQQPGFVVAMPGLLVFAALIAAIASDNFRRPRAWLLSAVVR